MTHATFWLPLVLTILLTAAASMLLKLATAFQDYVRWATMTGSLACYALAFVFYTMCLRNLPVSTVYPAVTGGSLVVIALGAAVFLREPLTYPKVLGMGLVAGGMFLLRPS